MADNQNQATKAEVQTTPLNKMPVPGENSGNLSAEEAAQVFEQAETTNTASANEE